MLKCALHPCPGNLSHVFWAWRSERKSGGFLPVNEILVLDEPALMDLPCPGWEGPAELHFATKATRFWFQSRRTMLQVSPACVAADVEAGGLSLKIPKGKRVTGPAHVWQIAVAGLGITVLEQVKSFMLQCPTRVWGLVCHYPIPVVLQWDTREENTCEGMMESCGAP